MPTIEVDCKDFESMLGLELHKDIDRINSILAYVKGEVKLFDRRRGLMNIEIKDTNRPDIWSVEGLTRALRGFLEFETGLKPYTINPPLIEIQVDARLDEIRPFIGCSIVKNAKLTDTVIKGLMQFQDKLDQSYGRKRQKTSIGLYDFSRILPPLRYTVAEPTEISFVPLGFEYKMSLEEILEKHPKGQEYGHIVKSKSFFPILLDSQRKVLSFPPIINSDDLGRITEHTSQILVEVTGTKHETVLNTLTLVTLSLIDRGGRAYQTAIHYSHHNRNVVTPTIDPWLMNLETKYASKVLGLKLRPNEIAELLIKARFGIRMTGKDSDTIEIPCYRFDVMHPIDLVEDIAIAYGYSNIEPLWRRFPTTGSLKPEESLFKILRELTAGLGFQEVLTYTLTNPESLFSKMSMKREKIIRIDNPKVQSLTCIRNWLLPSLMELLSNNLHVDYPQRIFELGNVTLLHDETETKTKDEKRLAAVTVHSSASFSEIMSYLDALFRNFGLEWQLEEKVHPTFIEGRVGEVLVGRKELGTVGEIHPKVLQAWKLENPAAAFELNAEEIVKIKENLKTRQEALIPKCIK